MIANKLKEALREELTKNILPYWTERMADPAGGYYGRRDAADTLHADAERGAILYGRILWTFSAAYRVLGDKSYLAAATNAFDYMRRHFIDPDYGGVYWSVGADGRPADMHKQFYALGFAIYGFSEYARATGNKDSLEFALSLYRDIETHSRDRRHGGYVEALGRDWSELDDVRLSAKDDNERKTMNTHLHILEPYTNLYRVAPSAMLKESITSLINVFLTRILDTQTGHLGLFFSDDWKRTDSRISYGHDIEASWLLLEAALVLGDDDRIVRMKEATRAIADAALEGRSDEGWLAYERRQDGRLDTERHWWVQAEDVVGLTYLYKHHGVEMALEKAWHSWQWISENLIDREHGEWYWSRLSDGTVNTVNDKAGFWKCPYHNGRMCLEILQTL